MAMVFPLDLGWESLYNDYMKYLTSFDAYVAKDTVQVLLDFGMTIEEALEVGLLIPSDVTPELTKAYTDAMAVLDVHEDPTWNTEEWE